MSAKNTLRKWARAAAGAAMVLACGGAGAVDQPKAVKKGAAPVVKPAPEDALLTPLDVKQSKTLSTRYSILEKRSIFSRDQRAKLDQPQEPTTRPAPRPEAYVVFTGVLQQEGQFWAFFEDTRERQSLTRAPGDSICGGKLLSVSLNGVEFQSASGRTRKIQQLQNMEGAPADLGPSYTPPSSSGSSSYGSRDGRSYDRGDRGSYGDRGDRGSYGDRGSFGDRGSYGDRSSRGYDGRSRSSDGRSSDRSSSDYRSSRDRGSSDGRSSDGRSSDRASSDRGPSDRGSSDGRGSEPSSGGPSAAPSGPPPVSGGSADDIVEQMRRRRAQEIGGGK